MSGKSMGGHQTTVAKTTVWLTPQYIIEDLGPFDLDPCAAPNWPTARRHIIPPDNGLTAVWEGRVWLNPPYSFEAWTWLARLADHGSGIGLVFARTETRGFVREVWHKAHGLLFLHRRIRFHWPDGTKSKDSPGAPSVLIAYGRADSDRLAHSSLDGTFVPVTKTSRCAC